MGNLHALRNYIPSMLRHDHIKRLLPIGNPHMHVTVHVESNLSLISLIDFLMDYCAE